MAPDGQEIKSKRALDRYLKSHAGGPVSADFDWTTGVYLYHFDYFIVLDYASGKFECYIASIVSSFFLEICKFQVLFLKYFCSYNRQFLF